MRREAIRRRATGELADDLAPIEGRAVVLISPNVSARMGGEAIKVFQFATWLQARGADVHLVTHGRCRDELAAAFPAERLHFVEDDRLQVALWKSRLFGFLLGAHFHAAAARIIRERFPDRRGVILHYVCPISPLEPRMVPEGYRTVIGPLNGNIGYPPALRHRATRAERTHAAAYAVVSRLLRPLLERERRGGVVLVSGGERTLDLLRTGPRAPYATVEVADSGVDAAMVDRVRTVHAGVNGRFYTCSRLVGWKGIDLAIRAVAACGEGYELHVIGDGERHAALAALAETIGAAGRVHFRGWLPHDTLAAELRGFRGFVFPSMCEANGIAMQEAMMSWVPVVALRWGGPTGLADDRSAILIEPASEGSVVAGIAQAMLRLAEDPAFANDLAGRAHRAAEGFTWDAVSRSWIGTYALARTPA